MDFVENSKVLFEAQRHQNTAPVHQVTEL